MQSYAAKKKCCSLKHTRLIAIFLLTLCALRDCRHVKSQHVKDISTEYNELITKYNNISTKYNDITTQYNKKSIIRQFWRSIHNSVTSK